MFAMNRRLFLGASFLGGVAGIAGMPMFSEESWANTPKRGGTITVSLNPEPGSLVSAFSTDGNIQMISAKLHDGLLDYDQNLKPIPSLAQSWSVAADGLSVTFKLRPNVKFHDGKPLTSEDVKFTLENILPKFNPQGQAIFSSLSRVDTPDALTAVVVLKEPAPYMLAGFSAFMSPILPKHIYDTAERPSSNPAVRAPIGSGPFRFVEWVRGDHVLLERNPDYWNPGKPYLDRIIFKVIPDPSTRVLAFEKGEVDFGTLSPVPIVELLRLAKLPHIKTTSHGLAMLSPVLLLGFNLDDPILKNVAVRRAIAHSLDLKALARVAWGGTVTAGTSPVSDLQPVFQVQDVPGYPFDRKKAEAMLDAAGYPRGAGGMRFTMNYDPLPWDENHRRTAEFIREQLRQIGIDVNMRSQDLASYMRRIWTDRDFQTYHTGTFNMPDPVIGMQRLYYSKAFVKGIPFSNSGYVSPAMDALWESARVELDTTKRQLIIGNIQRLAMEELPYIPLVNTHYQNVYNKRMQGFEISTAGAYANFADVWVTS